MTTKLAKQHREVPIISNFKVQGCDSATVEAWRDGEPHELTFALSKETKAAIRKLKRITKPTGAKGDA